MTGTKRCDLVVAVGVAGPVADHRVRVLSRRPRPAGAPTAVDWVTGELVSGRGLAAAVADVAVSVNCASNPSDPGSTSPLSASTASPTATTRPSSPPSG